MNYSFQGIVQSLSLTDLAEVQSFGYLGTSYHEAGNKASVYSSSRW